MYVTCVWANIRATSYKLLTFLFFSWFICNFLLFYNPFLFLMLQSSYLTFRDFACAHVCMFVCMCEFLCVVKMRCSATKIDNANLHEPFLVLHNYFSFPLYWKRLHAFSFNFYLPFFSSEFFIWVFMVC